MTKEEQKQARLERLELKNTVRYCYYRDLWNNPIKLTAIGIDKDGNYRIACSVPPENKSMHKKLARIQTLKRILSGDCTVTTELSEEFINSINLSPDVVKTFLQWVASSKLQLA